LQPITHFTSRIPNSLLRARVAYKMIDPITSSSTNHSSRSLSFRFEDGPAAAAAAAAALRPRTVSLLDDGSPAALQQLVVFPLAPSQTHNTPWQQETAKKMEGRIPYAGPNGKFHSASKNNNTNIYMCVKHDAVSTSSSSSQQESHQSLLLLLPLSTRRYLW
jgi:hypothetical protein